MLPLYDMYDGFWLGVVGLLFVTIFLFPRSSSFTWKKILVPWVFLIGAYIWFMVVPPTGEAGGWVFILLGGAGAIIVVHNLFSWIVHKIVTRRRV